MATPSIWAGVVARNASGKSMTDQTKDVLATIDGYLKQAGTDKSKLLSANIWITDMAKFAEMNAVWDGWVSPGNTPARATVEAKLAAPGYHVEIMAVAASARPRSLIQSETTLQQAAARSETSSREGLAASTAGLVRIDGNRGAGAVPAASSQGLRVRRRVALRRESSHLKREVDKFLSTVLAA